ncbi:MAG: hypothetical protein WC584_02895 [Candidatus Pacearchaeota archaeon]
MTYNSLDEVPELDIEALPIIDGFREAKIIDKAEVAYRNGLSMGIKDGEVTRTDHILVNMRYVLGKDSQRGRLYALRNLDNIGSNTAKFDPETVHNDIWIYLDSIKNYRSVDAPRG